MPGGDNLLLHCEEVLREQWSSKTAPRRVLGRGPKVDNNVIYEDIDNKNVINIHAN